MSAELPEEPESLDALFGGPRKIEMPDLSTVVNLFEDWIEELLQWERDHSDGGFSLDEDGRRILDFKATLAALPDTEIDIAKEIARKLPEYLAVPEKDKVDLYVWTEQVWSADLARTVVENMVERFRGVHRRVLLRCEAHVIEAVRALPKGEAGSEERKELYGTLRPGRTMQTRMGSDAGVRAITGRLIRLRHRTVRGQDLDPDPWLLNLANVTYDLRTYEPRPHDPRDLLTRITVAAYDPEAKAPYFMALLERVLPDPEVRAYLQQALGHALLGRVREHIMLVLYGSGRNGKGALLSAIRSALGDDYCTSVTPELILEHHEVQHPSDAMKLYGRRLAFMQETRAGRLLDAGRTKALTGGDPIDAHWMKKDWISFDPSHLLVLATNSKPRVSESNLGLWSRVKLVPFTVTIPEEEQDRAYGDRLALEADGVLLWLLDGYKAYEAAGGRLVEPQAVREATLDYAEESAPFAMFAAECLERVPGPTCTGTEIIERWKHWALANNDRNTQVNRRTIKQLMEEEGFVQAPRTKSTRPWRDVQIKPYEGWV